MTKRRVLVCVACLIISSAAGLHAQDKDLAWAVSRAPADSFVVVGARNLQGLWDGIKELSGQGDQLPDLPAMAETSLPASIDFRAAAVVIVTAKSGRSPCAVFMSRLKPGAELGGESLEGGVVKIVVPARPDVYALKMAPWVAMSDNLDSIKTLSAATARLTLTAQQKADVNSRSVWVWVNTKALAAEAEAAMVKNKPADGAPGQESNPAKVADWAVGLLSQIDSLTASADVKPEAAALTISLATAPKSQLALLAASAMPIESFKAGLPATGRILFAGWGRTDWVKAVAPAKSLCKPLLDVIVPASNADARKSLDELWAIYDEWAATLGNEVAFVLEPAPAGAGLYRMVETLSLKNPDAYRKLIAKTMPLSTSLAKVMPGVGAMRGAAPSPEMKMDYKPAAETIEGTPVDITRTTLSFAASGVASDEQKAAQEVMDAVYGPAGMTMRMAVVGRTAIISMGGAETMASAIKTAKGKGSDIASDPKVAAALARAPKDATFVGLISLPSYAHFTITMMERAMTAAMKASGSQIPPLKEPPAGDLVTLSARVQGGTQQIDLNIPRSEIRGMIDVFEQMSARMPGHRPPMQERKAREEPASDDDADLMNDDDE